MLKTFLYIPVFTFFRYNITFYHQHNTDQKNSLNLEIPNVYEFMKWPLHTK